MKTNNDSFKGLDNILEALPVETPSRNLVQAAMKEAYNTQISWGRPVIALAAALIIAVLVRQFDRSSETPPPSSLEIQSRLTQLQSRLKSRHSVVVRRSRNKDTMNRRISEMKKKTKTMRLETQQNEGILDNPTSNNKLNTSHIYEGDVV